MKKIFFLMSEESFIQNDVENKQLNKKEIKYEWEWKKNGNENENENENDNENENKN